MTLVVVEEVVGPLAVASAVITMTAVVAMSVMGTVKTGTTDGMRGVKIEVRVCLHELHLLSKSRFKI